MRILILSAALLATGPAIARDNTPPPPGKRLCHEHAILAADRGNKMGIRPLGEQGDVRQLRAVVRTVDGCSKPMLVNDRVGFNGR